MTAPILTKITYWYCTFCTFKDRTHNAEAHTRYHTCKSNGLTMPMIVQGTTAKVELIERGDYVGKELVTTDLSGRPVMSVVTTRDDGQDCAVFAPAAQANLKEE
jgi:hypothetical protein